MTRRLARNIKSCWIPVALSAALALPGLAAPATNDAFAYGPPTQLVPGEALLKLKDLDPHVVAGQAGTSLERDEAKATLDAIAARTGVRVDVMKPSLAGWAKYRVRPIVSAPTGLVVDQRSPTEDETRALIGKLASDPAVAAAAQNSWHRKLATPNDEYFDVMWHLDMINAPEGWDITTGLGEQRVGVVDTGVIRDHEDLTVKDVAGYDFIDDAFRGADDDERDAEYNDPGDGWDCGFGFQDSSFHGTHVSGTILASADNGIGVSGLNWAAGLVTARALGRCGGDSFDIMEGAAWMAGYQIDNVPNLPQSDKVSVMNLSLGSANACSGYEQDIIDLVNDVNVVFVAAAGNDDAPVGSPASCDGVITVAAFGPTGQLSSYSNFGPEVEIVAPGGDGGFEEGVASTVGPATDDYTFQQGTSMASPHVAGVISLMQAIDPTIDTEQEVADLLDVGTTCGGCDSFPALQMDLSLAAALERVGGVVEPEPEVDLEDDYEENDSFQTAAPLACGSEVELYAAGLDEDWFVLDAEPGSAVFVHAVSNNGGDIDLGLLGGPDLNTDVYAASAEPDGDEEVTLSAPAGDLAVLVYAWFNDTTGDDNADTYHLSVECTPAGQGGPEPEPEPDVVEPEPSPEPEPSGVVEPDPQEPEPGVIDGDDGFEPNNEPSEPSRVECGRAYDSQALDDDWHVVEVQDGDTLEVVSVASTAPARVEILSVLDPSVIYGGSAGSELEQRANVANLGGGDYLVRVYPTTDTTPYKLTVACSPTLNAGDGIGDEELVAKAQGCSHTALSGGSPGPVAAAWAALIGLALGFRRRRR